MPRRMRLLALVAGAAATIQPLAHGQSAAINGEITGTVTDPSGAAIAGAVIQISNPATGFKREIKASRVWPVPLHLAAVRVPTTSWVRRWDSRMHAVPG